MAMTRENIKDELFAVMQPYIERLREPEVIAAADAAKAAGVVKALYEKCVEGEPPRAGGTALSRAEIIDIVRSVMETAPDGKEIK